MSTESDEGTSTVRQTLEERADEWSPEGESDGPGEPDLEWAYGTLQRLTRMVAGGYTNILLLDAPGGLGKTYNVCKVLNEQADEGVIRGFSHQSGFTTPVELYKSLHDARHGDVLFLDDMSGIAGSTKSVNMLKAATDTSGDENWVEYKSSQEIYDDVTGEPLPGSFIFRGKIVMSFNETPDNKHFDALRDRGQDYLLNFSYEERIRIIEEVAKTDEISPLPYEIRADTVDWIKTVTDPSVEVSIRTLNNVLEIREYAETCGGNWQKDALEVFDLDYQKFIIVQMRQDGEMPVAEQVQEYCEKTGMSERHYYDKLAEVKDMLGSV